MEPDELSYIDLRNIIKSEKNAPKLTKLDGGFYRVVARRITALENEFMNHQRVNPSSRKLLLIADELRNTKRLFDEIYEIREKKIALAALSAARGSEPDSNNMTVDEKEFFTALRDILKRGRSRFVHGTEIGFDQSASASVPSAKTTLFSGAASRMVPGESGQAPVASAPLPTPAFGISHGGAATQSQSSVSPKKEIPQQTAEMQESPATVKSADPSCDAMPQRARQPSRLPDDISIVRALADIPDFIGTDMRRYEIKRNDVVTLPRDVSEILLKRGVVAEVKG
ncbi:MAG: hypothetical protein CVT48_01935 [Thermoplasmata archaeon HGW-Thermoplasmata-1]|nr:MAG: hypothetical protein CVT48_01935 [Thermoplasmata archaeon HGW-Thermoplasmata-1]